MRGFDGSTVQHCQIRCGRSYALLPRRRIGPPRRAATIAVCATLTAGLSIASFPAHAERQPAVQSRNANGTKIHYLIAGKGEPILLLPGYAHNSHMERPLMACYFAPRR